MILKRLFFGLNSQAKSISSAALIIGTAGLAAKILGVFRDRVLAGQFGAGSTLDMYYASFRIPDLVFNLIVLGALSAGFIPIFCEHMKKGEKEAWELVNYVLNLLILALVSLSVLLVIFAPFFMRLISPGFTAQEVRTSAELTRIMFLSPIFLGLSAVFGGVLQSMKRFFVYSLAPILYNVGIIIGAVFLTEEFGVHGLAWGVVLGAFMHLIVQLAASIALGFRYRPIFSVRHKGLRDLVRMMVPRTLSLAVAQLNLLVVVIIGSTLQDGSIAIFNFAFNLQSVPLGLFAISLAIASFPALSEAAGDAKEFIKTVSITMRQILFFMIPVSLLLIILRAQIVRSVFGSGRFDWEDTILTMNTLGIFSISLFAQGLIPLLSRAYFAQKDSRTPFFIGLTAAGVNIVLSIVFVDKFDHIAFLFTGQGIVAPILGLTLAYTLSNIIWLLLLWIILRVRLHEMEEMTTFYSVVKIAFASLCMGISVQALKYAIEPYFGTRTFTGIALQGTIAASVGIAVYLGVCYLVKSPEVNIFFSSFKRRFLKRFTPSETVE